MFQFKVTKLAIFWRKVKLIILSLGLHLSYCPRNDENLIQKRVDYTEDLTIDATYSIVQSSYDAGSKKRPGAEEMALPREHLLLLQRNWVGLPAPTWIAHNYL